MSTFSRRSAVHISACRANGEKTRERPAERGRRFDEGLGIGRMRLDALSSSRVPLTEIEHPPIPASKALTAIAQYALPASASLAWQADQFRVFTLACKVLPALRSQHNGLPCPPSTHGSGHRERLTTKASKSPRTPGKSSGCRHQEPHAHRNSSTAYDHPLAGFRSFVFTTPELSPHDPDSRPPRQPQVQIRRPF